MFYVIPTALIQFWEVFMGLVFYAESIIINSTSMDIKLSTLLLSWSIDTSNLFQQITFLNSHRIICHLGMNKSFTVMTMIVHSDIKLIIDCHNQNMFHSKHNNKYDWLIRWIHCMLTLLASKLISFMII